MRALYLLLTIVLLASTAATAQETIKLTYEQASNVQAGLTELDGPRKQVAADGRVLERGTYDFDIRTVVDIANNLARTRECVSLFQVGQNALQRKWADPKTGRVPEENLSAYVQELNEGARAVCSLKEFIPLKWEDLKPAANKLPASVISNLLPILVMPAAK